MTRKQRHEDLFIKIRETIELSCENGPETVILYGSFSRYEGTWDSDGKIINDIDLLIVTNKPSFELVNLKDNLKKKLGCEFVDISVIKESDLKKLRKRIFSYDLFKHGKCIIGSLNLKNFQFSSNKIKGKDIEILFRTRLWTFLGSYPESGFSNLNLNETIKFQYQVTKAIFSCIDCIAIQKKEYQSEYINKIKWARKQNEFKEFKDLISFAEQIKIENNLISNHNKEELIFKAAKMFEQTFSLGLGKYFCSRENLKNIVLKNYHFSIKAFIIKKAYKLRRRDGDKIFNLIVIQYLLFHYLYIDQSIDKSIIIKFGRKLNINSKNLDKIRIEVAKLRLQEA